MRAEIVCVGTELLLGDIVNTNAAFLARELASAGVEVYHQSVVGDNPGRLEEALRQALSRCDLVITTGGLGPTCDDLTKETAATLFRRELKLHTPSLEKMEAFFQKTGRKMTENNRKQALMPCGAQVIPNENGTAPGVLLEEEGKMLILLPGPPREMKPMFQKEVFPVLCRRSGSTLVSRNVHVFGMGESQVESLLRPLMEGSSNPTVAPYAKDGEMLLRITAKAGTEEEAFALMEPMLATVRETLGPVIYGIDTASLQEAAVQVLKEKGLRVASAESCTGGLISKRITEIPGASAVFGCGVCAYANEIKQRVLGVSEETLSRFGAVSEQTAREMAKGVRLLSGADIGISTTGIAGPDGGTPEKPVGLCYIAADTERGCRVIERRLARGYAQDRELIRLYASSHAIWLILQTAKEL